MKQWQYSLCQLQKEKISATIICAYDKQKIFLNTAHELPPTEIFLAVEGIEEVYHLPSGIEKNFQYLLEETTEEKVKTFLSLLLMDGTELDVAFFPSQKFPDCPSNFLYKEISVKVRFSGINKFGQAVWLICM